MGCGSALIGGDPRVLSTDAAMTAAAASALERKRGDLGHRWLWKVGDADLLEAVGINGAAAVRTARRLQGDRCVVLWGNRRGTASLEGALAGLAAGRLGIGLGGILREGSSRPLAALLELVELSTQRFELCLLRSELCLQRSELCLQRYKLVLQRDSQFNQLLAT